MTTPMTTLQGRVHGPAPQHREAATTLPATPGRVDVAELADSVVLLTPGRSIVVSARDAPRWCATAADTSVATVHHTTGHSTGLSHVPADGEEVVVCTLLAAGPGRTRGHLIAPSGQRHPFEVIVISADHVPHRAADCAPAARRVSSSSRSSWAARLRRRRSPTGRPLSSVTVAATG